MNHDMTPPDVELARRLLASVPYAHRLPAGRLRPPVGIIPGDLRSLEEVYHHLAPDDRSLPGVNLTALSEWIDRAVGDSELAEAIRTVTGEGVSYVEGCLKVYELVGIRLAQARTVHDIG